MKYISILLLFLCAMLFASGQNTLPKAVIKDFSITFYYQHHYQKNGFVKSVAFLAGRRLGYELIDIEIAVEQMETNVSFREETFKTLNSLGLGKNGMMPLQLISLGMQASNAKILSNYIINKYQSQDDNKKNLLAQEQKGDDKSYFERVDKEASYVGGYKAYQKYLIDSLRYPDSAYNNNIGGKVVINFVIDLDGKVTDVKVKEGAEIGYGIPEEAVRLIKSMPKWEPSSIKGKPIKAFRRQALIIAPPPNAKEEGIDKTSAVTTSGSRGYKPVALNNAANSKENVKNNFNTKAIDLFKINSASELIDHFGIDNVKKVKASGYEGQDLGYEYQIFPKTTKEAFLFFAGEQLEHITFVKKNSYWELPYDLKIGMTIHEVQVINKHSFTINPMEMDLSGLIISWDGGKLEDAGISVKFTSTKDDIPNYNEFIGSEIKSDKKNINKLGLVIEEIKIYNPVYNK